MAIAYGIAYLVVLFNIIAGRAVRAPVNPAAIKALVSSRRLNAERSSTHGRTGHVA
jgi:hypothetical protein